MYFFSVFFFFDGAERVCCVCLFVFKRGGGRDDGTVMVNAGRDRGHVLRLEVLMCEEWL